MAKKNDTLTKKQHNKPTKMLAKYATKCKYCNDKVEVGEIIQVYNDKWYHVSCQKNVVNGRKNDITQKAEPGLKSLPKDPPVVSMFTKDKGILDGKPGTDADFHKEAAEEYKIKEGMKEQLLQTLAEIEYGMLNDSDIINDLIEGCEGWRNMPDRELIYHCLEKEN